MSKAHKKDDLTCDACDGEEDDEEGRRCDICGYNISEYADSVPYLL